MISKSIGFSQKTAFPAFADIVINFVCVGVAEAIRIASTFFEFIASSGEFATEQLVEVATSLANFEFTSKTYFKFVFGCDEIIFACILPIRPAPIREKLIIRI